jgi:hypothetical protein
MLPTKFHFIWLRRRLKCEKLTDDGRWTPSDGKSSLCLWQGELKNYETYRHNPFETMNFDWLPNHLTCKGTSNEHIYDMINLAG